MVTIKFDTDNAAFEDNPNEIRSLLDELAFRIQNSQPGDSGSIKDSNGNTVGSWSRS
jgi:hypothetical protein